MLESIFYLYQTKMIDVELWERWEATAKSMTTNPQIRKSMDNTKESRAHEFVKIIHSLIV